MVGGADQTRVRLAELVAALSLGIDLGFGQPMEHVLRQCLIALRLADRIGLDEDVRAEVYYTALLINVGCHTDAHEQSKWFGDDIALKSHKYDYEPRSVRGVAAGARLVGSGHPPLQRFRIGLEFAFSGHREVENMIAHHAALTAAFARQLALSDDVVDALGAAYEQWDGRGWPGELSGAEVPLAARLAQLAEFVEVALRVGGVKAAKEIARKRAGKQFDPELATLMGAEAELILSDLDTIGSWDAVIEAEPALAITLSDAEFDAALLAIANFVDLKSPYTLGHAKAVADLAAAAATRLMPPDQVLTLRRAGLVHDLGRLGVSNAIWDKRGPLGAGEWERVRLHPHLTERMLHQSGALAPLGAIAVQHRERLDGSGYPRAFRRLDLTACSHPRSSRRIPGDARAAPPSAATLGRRGGQRASRGGEGGPTRCRGSRSRPRSRRTSRVEPTRRAGRADGARGRRAQAARAWLSQQQLRRKIG